MPSDVFRETNRTLTDQTLELASRLMCDTGLIDGVCWVFQASRSGHLSRHEQQLMLRVAHEDIQLDAMKLRFSKQSSLQRLSHSPDLYRTPSPIQVIADRP